MPSTERRDPMTGQPVEAQTSIETKEFFRTSEFWVLTVAAFGLLLTTLASGTFGAQDAWPWATILAATYILARGIAKMGTAHPFHGRSDMRSIRERVAEVVGGEGTIRQSQPEPVYDMAERRYPTESIPPVQPQDVATGQPSYGHPGAPSGRDVPRDTG